MHRPERAERGSIATVMREQTFIVGGVGRPKGLD